MRYLLVLLIMLLSFSSFAVEYTPETVPKNLHVYNTSGSTYVDLVAAGCSSYRYYLNPVHEKYDIIVSILLAAQVANKKVVVIFDGCVNGGNPQGNIVGVYLK
ncbi:hypothetical protein [Shewanella algae]|uniref:hypothetical protein n=1 Tax=Shewanella algae TaxID=38313 RepID=UPI0031F572EB